MMEINDLCKDNCITSLGYNDSGDLVLKTSGTYDTGQTILASPTYTTTGYCNSAICSDSLPSIPAEDIVEKFKDSMRDIGFNNLSEKATGILGWTGIGILSQSLTWTLWWLAKISSEEELLFEADDSAYLGKFYLRIDTNTRYVLAKGIPEFYLIPEEAKLIMDNIDSILEDLSEECNIGTLGYCGNYDLSTTYCNNYGNYSWSSNLDTITTTSANALSSAKICP